MSKLYTESLSVPSEPSKEFGKVYDVFLEESHGEEKIEKEDHKKKGGRCEHLPLYFPKKGLSVALPQLHQRHSTNSLLFPR